jgi:ppGpp synthetase/RelA/SpoT-type nucleotidyltranferase
MDIDLLIRDFLALYSREYDFYDQSARLAAQFLEGRLRTSGIRSIVTSRPKALGGLEEKVRDRAKEPKKNYASVDDIFNDIVDLAGVRIAMYFPGEQDQVENIIQELFSVQKVKRFPDDSPPPEDLKPQYKKRFSGYWARHYRVQLKDSILSDAQKRYAEARIEIQVASVLMHSWAEVEHDLIYKPHQGELSNEELAILDELNGLVLAGEIAFEQLQRAGETRVAAGGRDFSNHYDLAAHLLSSFAPSIRVPIGETTLGRIDILFEFLRQLHLGTPDQIRKYIQYLDPDLEKRPLADQISDQLLAEDESRYPIYNKIRASRPVSGEYVDKTLNQVDVEAEQEISRFLQLWVALERKIKEKAKESGAQGIYPSSKLLSNLGIKDQDLLKDFEGIRRTRNEVVHGMSMPSTADLRDLSRRIEEVSEQLKQLGLFD